MAEIRITIPDNKAQLLLDAVTFYMCNEAGEDIEVTGAMALKWLKGKLVLEVKRLVRNYQEQKYREEFLFNDPLEE